VFHNAYGPDKPWFRDPALSGGGCVIDLGTHLVDLALHLLAGAGAWVAVDHVDSQLFAGGRLLDAPGRVGGVDVVEDFATARIDLAGGSVLTLSCSWNLHAGQEAVISATFYGTDGAVALSNVGGSFYDFRAVRNTGTSRTVLVEPPDDWGGRAAVAWTRRLAEGARFDHAASELVATAEVLDRIYGR
jgi:predicted dehydrogenase